MNRSQREIVLELLVTRHRRGDETALTELIEKWERPLFYYIRRLAPNEEDAWDILQNVWMQVMKGLRNIRDARALSAWLYKIARNCAISHLRKTQRLIALNEEEIEREMDQEPIEFDHHPVEAIELHQAIQSLPVLQREAIVLHFLEDFSLEEIACIADAPVGTVKSRLHYAKSALKTKLTCEDSTFDSKGERHD